jgi:Xaa-Pro aminopeptidase
LTLAIDLETRLKRKISDAELQRRWNITRQAMKEKKLDFLLLQNSTDHLAGAYRWLTDVPPTNNYTATLIFPREEDMIMVSHGGWAPDEPHPPAWAVRGVAKRISVPALPSLGYSTVWDAEKVVEELAPFKNAHIGLVGMGFLSASMYKYVTEHLNSVKFEDVTDIIDALMVKKSDEEIQCIRDSCAIQDATFAYILKRVQPGMTESEVMGDVKYKCMALGSEQGILNVSSAPYGKAANMFALHYANRVIEDGDTVFFMIETNGPSGLYSEIMRIICLGKIPSELEKQYEMAQAAQKVTLDAMEIGANAVTVFNANNAFMKSHGYPEERRLFAHGQGYNLVERPCLIPGEPMKLQARMNIAVHPMVRSEKAFAAVCENYLIKENGEKECLHKTPQKIWVP